MKKLALLALSASLLTACGETAAPVTTTPTMSPSPLSQQYTLADVNSHNQPTDCWMVIHDKVYNVTPLIASGGHAGGPVISEGCGKDATTLFENRPGEGTPHSAEARSYLPNFFIGNLKK